MKKWYWLAIGFMSVLVSALAFFVATEMPKKNQNLSISTGTCISLGCPENTKFVGSITSNIYHKCNCTFALRIHPENIKCFASASEAEEEGYSPCKFCIK